MWPGKTVASSVGGTELNSQLVGQAGVGHTGVGAAHQDHPSPASAGCWWPLGDDRAIEAFPWLAWWFAHFRGVKMLWV